MSTQDFLTRVFTKSPQMLMSPAEFVSFVAAQSRPGERPENPPDLLDGLIEVARLIAAQPNERSI